MLCSITVGPSTFVAGPAGKLSALCSRDADWSLLAHTTVLWLLGPLCVLPPALPGSCLTVTQIPAWPPAASRWADRRAWQVSPLLP